MNWLNYFKSSNMAKAGTFVLGKIECGLSIAHIRELPIPGNLLQKVGSPSFDSHVLLRQENRTLTPKFYDLLYNCVAWFSSSRVHYDIFIRT